MAMVPYMAAGYAVDRMMGGSGMTGLALGTDRDWETDK